MKQQAEKRKTVSDINYVWKMLNLFYWLYLCINDGNPLAFYYSYIRQKPLLDLLPEIHAIHVSERTGDQEYAQRKEIFYSFGSERLDTEIDTTSEKEMPEAEHSLEYNEECMSVHYLQKLKNLCDDRGIKLVVITSPILESTYREGVEHGYLDFLCDVAKVTDFYCFSRLNEYTTHPIYYFDASHFKPYVGFEMEKVVFGNEEVRRKARQSASQNHHGAPDFSIRVTSDNVNAVIKQLRDEL